MSIPYILSLPRNHWFKQIFSQRNFPYRAFAVGSSLAIGALLAIGASLVIGASLALSCLAVKFDGTVQVEIKLSV